MKPNKILFFLFISSVCYVVGAELIFINYYTDSVTLYRVGQLFLKLAYSITASSIFFSITTLLPKKLKREKILQDVEWKTELTNRIITGLLRRIEATSQRQINLSSKQRELLSEVDTALARVNPDEPVLDYISWHKYLYSLKKKLSEIIQSLKFHKDSLTDEYLNQLILIENLLIASSIFEGHKKYAVTEMTYASIELIELFKLNEVLQIIKNVELAGYKEKFAKDAKAYRDKYYDKE